MAIAHSILPEFKYEMSSTRKVLERVPEEQALWKPHLKSRSLGNLANHIATTPAFVPLALTRDEFDFADANAENFPREFSSRAALLEVFERNAAAAISAIAEMSDEEIKKPWTLKNQGRVVFSLPRVAVLRSFVLNHLIHHRGQLTVYLRLKDVPLPAIYGNTADEK